MSAPAFGVPKPVGPSQPAAALHRSVRGAQVPFEPDITSHSLAVLFAMNWPDDCPPLPVAAKTAATNGAAALVPPTRSQPALVPLVL